jgi:predicted LPLAT superfamily acyltransferase
MPTTANRPEGPARGWRQVRELGTDWGLYLAARFALWAGRRRAHVVLRLLALHYFLFHAAIRRRSRVFLQAVGADAGTRAVYRHLLRFAECSLDRFFFLRGETADLDLGHHGHEHVMELARQKRGAILLGAHLGSFESLRCLGQTNALPLNIVADVRNAVRFQRALARLVPSAKLQFIDAGGSAAQFALDVRSAVERGELVAILADRISGPRTVVAPFLGRQAYFPAGPFLVAAVLGCPVYLAFGLYFAPRRYELYCEPLAQALVLPRKTRDEALADIVATYAARLEYYCRLAPDNWFNFFDFFKPPSPDEPAGPPSSSR